MTESSRFLHSAVVNKMYSDKMFVFYLKVHILPLFMGGWLIGEWLDEDHFG